MVAAACICCLGLLHMVVIKLAKGLHAAGHKGDGVHCGNACMYQHAGAVARHKYVLGQAESDHHGRVSVQLGSPLTDQCSTLG